MSTNTIDPLKSGPSAGPWKSEVVLYDHPNAQSVSVFDATLLEDDTLIVPIGVAWRGPFIGYDWFEVEDTLTLNLVSQDRGLSWQVHDGRVPEKRFQLADGSLFRMEWKGYESHPVAEQAAFEEAGFFVYPIPERKLFSVTGGFRTRVSSDGGKSWVEKDIPLPHRASLAGYGMATARHLADGTILMPQPAPQDPGLSHHPVPGQRAKLGADHHRRGRPARGGVRFPSTLGQRLGGAAPGRAGLRRGAGDRDPEAREGDRHHRGGEDQGSVHLPVRGQREDVDKTHQERDEGEHPAVAASPLRGAPVRVHGPVRP